MQAEIESLRALQDELAAALAAGDSELAHELCQRRQSHLTALATAWQIADDAERQRLQGALAALQRQEQELIGRSIAARDDLHAQLIAGPRRGVAFGAPLASGLIDRQG